MITLLVADEDHVGGGRQVMSDKSCRLGMALIMKCRYLLWVLEWAHNYTLIRVRIPLIYDGGRNRRRRDRRRRRRRRRRRSSSLPPLLPPPLPRPYYMY